MIFPALPIQRRPGARALALSLLAVFWIAQLHGLAHGISHASAARGFDGPAAPHAFVCTDCVGAAESGAAPVLAALALVSPPVRGEVATAEPPSTLATGPASRYRSRAPPIAPT